MTRLDEPSPPVERTIERGDRAFRVLTSATAGGTGRLPFVLIHGIGMSHRYLARLHDRLALEGVVHSVDLPGFGGLPKPVGDIDVEAMAASLGEVLDDLGIGPAIVVGHSMGAQWAVELGVQRPDLVRGVVAMGPVTDDRHRSLPAQALALGLESLGEPPTVNAIVFTDYVRCGVRWYLTQVRHMLAYPIEDRAAELTTPLLVLRGGDDPVAGLEWCRRLRDCARDGALVVVPGHNHVVQQTAPRSVASALGAFVSGRTAGGWMPGARAADELV
jgi:pimeloyl-ACP methyl ester carboxylesterase